MQTTYLAIYYANRMAIYEEKHYNQQNYKQTLHRMRIFTKNIKIVAMQLKNVCTVNASPEIEQTLIDPQESVFGCHTQRAL